VLTRCCAAAVLLPRFGSAVRLPDDIQVLVGQGRQLTRHIPGVQRWTMRVGGGWTTMRRTEKAKNFQISEPTRAGRAILGWVSGSVGEADDESQGQGQVGDGAPCLEAILV